MEINISICLLSLCCLQARFAKTQLLSKPRFSNTVVLAPCKSPHLPAPLWQDREESESHISSHSVLLSLGKPRHKLATVIRKRIAYFATVLGEQPWLTRSPTHFFLFLLLLFFVYLLFFFYATVTGWFTYGLNGPVCPRGWSQRTDILRCHWFWQLQFFFFFNENRVIVEGLVSESWFNGSLSKDELHCLHGPFRVYYLTSESWFIQINFTFHSIFFPDGLCFHLIVHGYTESLSGLINLK